MLKHGWTLKTLWQVKEVSQKRPHTLRFHFYKMSRIGKSIETENKLVVVRPGVGVDGEWLLMPVGFVERVIKI